MLDAAVGFSATLGGGVTGVTFMQIKSAVTSKITSSTQQTASFHKLLSDTVLHFPFSQFHTIYLTDFLLFLHQKLVDRYGYSSIAIRTLSFICHAKPDTFLPGFDCFILFPLI